MTIRRVGVDVATRAPTGQTSAYVVGRDPALLVDPAARTGRLDAVAAERSVGHVAVTHHHPDHVGAVAAYADRHDAALWARRGRTDAFANATGRDPDRTFTEGTVVETGSGPVRVVDTSGHAPEHVAFAFGGDLLCGDLAVAEGSVVVGAPEGDVRAYLTALRRVHAMAPGRLYPGHGPVIGDPRAVARRLIEHRLAREKRVRAAVVEGARTVEEVCAAAYEKDLDGVRDLALATVRAHLAKLAVEGDLAFDGERARPTD